MDQRIEKKILLVHPTGNTFVRSLARELAVRKILSRFYTTIAIFPNTWLYKIGKNKLLSEILRREYHSDLIKFTKSSSWREWGRLFATKLKLFSMTKHETGFLSVDSVYRGLDKRVARHIESKLDNDIDGIYCYEDGALHSFKVAKEQGIKCLYDLPIGYWRAMHEMLGEERYLNPDWASTLTGFKDSAIKLSNKDAELLLADHIFVASTFTKNTLDRFPGILAPISIIPYGFPDVTHEKTYIPLKSRKLKLLFVGGLSQRKGIANLFEAVSDLTSEIELTVVGNKTVEDCIPLNNALSKHTWHPSLPHQAVLEVMRINDVLVFPSLFEGFGLVVTEAMSQGTPVITTERTCGPDIIIHGDNGWLIKAGDTNALKQMLLEILRNPSIVETVGRNAMQTAKKRPWRLYGSELTTSIEQVIL